MSNFPLLYFLSAFFITVSAYPYGLEVTDVRAESAVLKWTSTEHNVEEFKIHCSGIRHYITAQKEPHTELDVLTHFVPGSLAQLLIGNVHPNFNYSCMVTEELDASAQVFGNKVSDPFHFATDYRTPEQPKSPIVHKQKDQQQKIELFPVSSKYGPILGYKVQFHVVDHEAPDGTAITHEERFVLTGELAPSPPSVAKTAHKPKSFQLSFTNNSLPKYIHTSNESLIGALKNGVKYTVVTIAYSRKRRKMNTNSDDNNMFSVSKPSQSFIAKVQHSVAYGLADVRKASPAKSAQLAIALSVGMALPLLIICWVVIVALILLCRAQKIRRRLRYIFTREDVIEANKLRKTHTRMQWLESPQPMGDLPWLDPEYSPGSPSINHDFSQSTPTLHVPSSSQTSPGPSSLLNESLIEFSPDVKRSKKEVKTAKGYILSEPTSYDVSTSHKHSTPDHTATPPSPHSPDPCCSTTHQSNAATLHYSTIADQHDGETRPISLNTSNNSNQSITRFYSAPDFSQSQSSLLEQEIPPHSSSSVFLPRGLSTGPPLLVPRSAGPTSPIITLLTELSGGESGQEDQAPDLELDLFDLSII